MILCLCTDFYERNKLIHFSFYYFFRRQQSDGQLYCQHVKTCATTGHHKAKVSLEHVTKFNRNFRTKFFTIFKSFGGKNIINKNIQRIQFNINLKPKKKMAMSFYRLNHFYNLESLHHKKNF